MVRAATRPLTLITGATSGIGRATAGLLAARGHRLLLVGRNQDKTQRVCRELAAEAVGLQTEALVCDMSEPQQIKSLVKHVRRAYGGLDVLVNNAGVVCPEYSETAQGIETTFAVNHLGYFMLTGLLWDSLAAGGRVINVASHAHRHGRLHWEDVNLSTSYGYYKAYAQSKLANLLFTFELAARLESKKVTANVLHPGVVATNIWPRHRSLLRTLIDLAKPWMSSPEQGAQTVAFLADDRAVAGVSGAYFANQKQLAPASKARDREAARRLWSLSERLSGVDHWPRARNASTKIYSEGLVLK